MLIDFWNLDYGYSMEYSIFWNKPSATLDDFEFLSTVHTFLLKSVRLLFLTGTFIQWDTFIPDHILRKGRHRHVKAWRNA